MSALFEALAYLFGALFVFEMAVGWIAKEFR